MPPSLRIWNGRVRRRRFRSPGGFTEFGTISRLLFMRSERREGVSRHGSDPLPAQRLRSPFPFVGGKADVPRDRSDPGEHRPNFGARLSPFRSLLFLRTAPDPGPPLLVRAALRIRLSPRKGLSSLRLSGGQSRRPFRPAVKGRRRPSAHFSETYLFESCSG